MSPIGDMNERAARPRLISMAPMEIPLTVNRNGRKVITNLHEVTDEDIASMLPNYDPDEGWRWARSVAWLLAGNPPRPWQPREDKK